MFSKLLKHEWRQSAGLLGILSACALGAGVLGTLVLKGILYMDWRMTNEKISTIGLGGLSSALGFIFIALVAYIFAVQFITLYRFYKNKFTDEGYLTFTLPVSTRQIFLASFLNILIWLVISTLVMVAAVGMIIFVGASGPLKEYQTELRMMLQEILGLWRDEVASEPGFGTYQVLSGISTLINPVYTVVLLMTSITMGSVLAKKHKILATIGLYYCITFAISMVESSLSVVPYFFMLNDYSAQPYVYTSISLVTTMVLQVVLCFGGFFLSTRLMRKKLNLP